MIGLIKRNFTFIDIPIFLHLYRALIRPHLEYGQAIWSPQFVRQSKLIENVQRRATKLIPNLKNLSYSESMLPSAALQGAIKLQQHRPQHG